MIVGEYLAQLRRLPIGRVDDLVGDAAFLVLSPHPDDETLGCGGLLAASTTSRSPGHVMILTDGAGSHPGSVAFPPERLVALRRSEAEAAVEALGLGRDRLAFLGLPDTAAPSDGPAFDAAVDTVVATAERVGARTLFVTSGQDPHCDHVAAFAIARAAARILSPIRLWAYPVWSWHLDPRSDVVAAGPAGLRLGIAEVQPRKRQAIACYASQMTGLIDDDPNGFSFTDAQLAPFLGAFEYFVETRP